MNALRVDPTNASVFVAGAGLLGAGGLTCGGVYRSTNAGSTWTASSLSGVYVTDLAIDPVAPARVYACAGYLGGSFPKGGAYASVDGGADWSNLVSARPRGRPARALRQRPHPLCGDVARRLHARRRRRSDHLHAGRPDALPGRRPIPRHGHLDQAGRVERPGTRGHADRRHRLLLVLRQRQRRGDRQGPRGVRRQRVPLGLRERPDQRPGQPHRHRRRQRDHQHVQEPAGDGVPGRSRTRRRLRVREERSRKLAERDGI